MSFSDLKGFAFDLDGVIADTARFHGQAWRQIADKVGTEWTPELADGLKGMSRMDVIRVTGSYGKSSSKNILNDILNLYNTLLCFKFMFLVWLTFQEVRHEVLEPLPWQN